MTTVRLASFESPTENHREIADRAVELIEKIVNSEQFLHLVRTSTYSSTWRATASGRRQKLQAIEIAQVIQHGEELGTEPDEQIHLEIVIEPLRSNGTLGYVRPPSPIITTNLSFVDACSKKDDPLSLAQHWLHEWMHVAGFYHPWRGKRRDVAYRVGDFALLVGRDFDTSGLLKANRAHWGLIYLESLSENECPVHETAVSEMTLSGHEKVWTAAGPIIDIHTHTFNASDLSVEGFVSEVLADTDERYPLFDPLVRFLARLVRKAPNAEAELRRLDRRDALLNANLKREFSETEAAEARDEATDFEAELAEEIVRLRDSGTLDDQALYQEILQEVESRKVTNAPLGPTDIIQLLRAGVGFIGRHVNWVRRLRRYRADIIAELIQTYGRGPGDVDLFVSAQVDFARWLDDEPFTPHAAQVRVGDRLSRTFPGRIHFLAAFDPFREVVSPGTPDGSLHTVKLAMEHHGFLGVKLYPPMGFSAIGNVDHDFSALRRPVPQDFGRRLDEVLEEFYSWAESSDVPIMAHCNNSISSREGYGLRAAPHYWERVLDQHPNLRLNLAHFGGQQNLGTEGEWPAKIIAMMANPATPYVFADIGMFHLHGASRREEWFERLASEIGKAPRLAGQVMYGSDWLMLAKEEGAADFLRIFKQELGRYFSPDQFRAALGGNAMRFLGLDTETHASRRMRKYYQTRGLSLPTWLPAED